MTSEKVWVSWVCGEEPHKPGLYRHLPHTQTRAGAGLSPVWLWLVSYTHQRSNCGFPRTQSPLWSQSLKDGSPFSWHLCKTLLSHLALTFHNIEVWGKMSKMHVQKHAIYCGSSQICKGPRSCVWNLIVPCLKEWSRCIWTSGKDVTEKQQWHTRLRLRGYIYFIHFVIHQENR